MVTLKGHTSGLIPIELIISAVFTLHTWRMKEVCHYLSLELASIPTKPHQAPLTYCTCYKQHMTDKKYCEKNRQTEILTVRKTFFSQ